MSKLNLNINHIPSYQEYEMSATLAHQYMCHIYPQCTFLLWDAIYWTVHIEDWNEIFIDVAKSMPAYTVDKFDCDNFALLTAARVNERYQLNSCGIAIGNTPQGYHGWTVFITPDEAMFYEPQTGQIMELENPEAYKPDIIILG